MERISFTLEKPFISKFDRLMEVTDLFMLDVKDMSEEKHKTLTGWSNRNILQMADYLSEHEKEMWIRHVLVPGLTDGEEELSELRDFVQGLKTVSRVEILPYHTLGEFKWEKLEMEYPLKGVRVPTDEEVSRAEEMLGIKNL